MQSDKPRILIFVNYYLPGYEAGGPLRTIANMVDHLGDEFEFCIVTRDRDINDKMPYSNVVVDEWQAVGEAQVIYISPKNETVAYFKRLIAATRHDLIYLNSFFHVGYTIKPLVAWRLLLPHHRRPVIVAPRGELSPAAFRLKTPKKKAYLWAINAAGLYRKVVFQASSAYEATDIANMFPSPSTRIKVAMDLPARIDVSEVSETTGIEESSDDKLRIVFLSRITPMKNLDFALRVLEEVTSEVHFDIYGPITDDHYWNLCRELMATLPDNIAVKYHGSVAPTGVGRVFSRYDLFFLPTRGENYGHVIAEALTVGTPVLISDQTPWRDLTTDGLGWDLPLQRPDGFRQRIESMATTPAVERRATRSTIRRQGVERILPTDVIDANRQMLRSVLVEEEQRKG